MREWDQIIVHKLSTSAEKSYTLVIKALQQQKKEMGTENQVWVIKKMDNWGPCNRALTVTSHYL